MRQCSLLLSRLCSKQRPSFQATAATVIAVPGAQRCLQSIVSTSPQRGLTSLSAFSSTTSSPPAKHTPAHSRVTGESTNVRHVIANTSRHASTGSSSKWLARQSSDRFTREAKVANLKSRAAFKLLQINERYRIFQPGMTVVDLGYAPGSWSQVAIDLVRPGLGRVVGVDVIPVQPPKGVNGIQGDFLSLEVQERVRDFLQDEARGRVRRPSIGDEIDPIEDQTVIPDQERRSLGSESTVGDEEQDKESSESGHKCVDVVLSDMSAPWEITSGLSKNSISNPYRRMMNTTGNKFRDHAGSMDLCRAALYFSYENLKVGGNFVCKFYQGAEDRVLEKQMKALFGKVHREKPESSRSESREAFFVCLKRLAKVDRNKVFSES